MPRIYKKPCDFCGIFYKSSAKRTCSRRCWFSIYKKSINWLKFRDKHCKVCKNVYKPPNSTGERCKKCSVKYSRERHINATKQWRKNNPLYGKIRYWKNPEKERMKSLNRRHLKRANGGRGFSLSEWNLMKQKYDFTCQICKKKEPKVKLTQDHILPVIHGGKHEMENIRPLCLPCNARRGSRI